METISSLTGPLSPGWMPGRVRSERTQAWLLAVRCSLCLQPASETLRCRLWWSNVTGTLRGWPTSATRTLGFAFCSPPVQSASPPVPVPTPPDHIPRMATLTRTKSETVSTLESDLAASVPAPFPAFTRVQSSRGPPSILLSQPQQQGSTQQLVDVNVDISQQPALPIGVEVAETAQLANALVGGSSSRRYPGSFSRSVGGSTAFCYSCHSFEHPTH
jgi:hypothetical protein